MIKLCSVEKNVATIELSVELSGSMLESEERIQCAVNEAGVMLSRESLRRFGTDGSPLMTGAVKWTSKGQVDKVYQTPYGEARVGRHVYQSSAGGKTHCPLDVDARIVASSTPRFARMIAHKVADSATTVVQRDLAENHGCKVSRDFVHKTAEAVGAIAQLKGKNPGITRPRNWRGPSRVSPSGSTARACSSRRMAGARRCRGRFPSMPRTASGSIPST